ncbi:MAG: phosphomannomutase / phosphoglucomutase [Parcubacteria group bacterium Gr01-1014_107]|nr:MAG: phosphomannomutase / phosphoglucomutase [Parcubacteria group bacterium Gr01-1014_107]
MAINKRIFKAYDIRGIYPSELGGKTAFLIGQTCASYFRGGVFIVGYDARLSSRELLKSFLSGFRESAQKAGKKFKVRNISLTTTPMFYFLVKRLKAVGGAMVTASHNPKEYNGFKIVGAKAKPISGKEIEKLMIGNRR